MFIRLIACAIVTSGLTGVDEEALASSQQTRGPCSQAVGTSNGSTIYVNVCPNFGSGAKEKYLIATHPTRLEIKGTRFQAWEEDHGISFINLTFANSSDIPAQNVTFDILKWKDGFPLYKLKPLPIHRSKVLDQQHGPGFSVDANTEVSLPAISVDEFESLMLPATAGTYCLFDAGVQRWDESKQPELKPAHDEVMHKPPVQTRFVLKLMYSSIFGERITRYIQMFAYYADQLDHDSPIWYPNRGAFDPFQCARAGNITVTVGSPR